ncbi:FAD-binding domain-containing protein [Corynespora cassiicola Philippines]|uniref:FAD-binding domain-containing protein n=1 Tax=Corynespora cassiicola Philippines TaxID=1448308 RepID=A0A2T2N0K7_CORCC|nr:FAD-binding domain-containing protein [Corynespora cassiicola Philippines]
MCISHMTTAFIAHLDIAELYPDAVDWPGAAGFSESIKQNCLSRHGWVIFDEQNRRSQTDSNADSSYQRSALTREASIVFHPSSAEELAKALRIVEFFRQSFAIRGGGHSPNPGWASIEGGILISTDRMSTLHFDAASETVSIGAGNRWGRVYKHLEKYGVLVTGGHSAPVGCVGQITGCGNSPWFHKYGWSCDNVVNFEVVVSGGKIVNANKDENPDLWWALKGGSNNFGIVTRMDMSTFPLPDGVWGGQLYYDHSQATQRQTIEAYYRFQMEHITQDSGVECLSGWAKIGPYKHIQKVLSADRAMPGNEHPKSFDDFFKLTPSAVRLGNCLASELAAHDEQAAVENSLETRVYFSEATRSLMLCLVTKADLDFYFEAVDIFYSAFEESYRGGGLTMSVQLSCLYETRCESPHKEVPDLQC